MTPKLAGPVLGGEARPQPLARVRRSGRQYSGPHHMARPAPRSRRRLDARRMHAARSCVETVRQRVVAVVATAVWTDR